MDDVQAFFFENKLCSDKAGRLSMHGVGGPPRLLINNTSVLHPQVGTTPDSWSLGNTKSGGKNTH